MKLKIVAAFMMVTTQLFCKNQEYSALNTLLVHAHISTQRRDRFLDKVFTQQISIWFYTLSSQINSTLFFHSMLYISKLTHLTYVLA